MIAALLTFAALLPPPAPDYIPSGWKGVRLRLIVESGDGVRGLCFAHRVERGETLAGIAGVELGDPARADEIAARNAGLETEQLQHNSYLWLPPALPPAAGETLRLVYVDTGRARLGPGPLPFQPGDVSGAVTRNGELVLFLVPVAQTEAFERARAERHASGDRGPSAVTRMIEAGDVIALRCPIDSAYVRDDASIARRSDVFTIEREPETGALSLTRRSSRAFGVTGEELDAAHGDAGGDRKGQALLLLAFAGAALAGLGALARGRRPALAAGAGVA